jgi:hypothetical protein
MELPVGERKKEGKRQDKEEERRRTDPKGLNTISENCRDLFVRQNFPLI